MLFVSHLYSFTIRTNINNVKTKQVTLINNAESFLIDWSNNKEEKEKKALTKNRNVEYSGEDPKFSLENGILKITGFHRKSENVIVNNFNNLANNELKEKQNIH